ncbi:putative HTH-type transcriptional regulator YdjF [Weizmannia acidilactici]|uniref:HTH-type transcriptional regulator YdjF n=1 Tax=Weizmannia acidilactici TaxID=2607726 RepID=A0A5J4J8E4_9BACI|nr:DeoR/GlpR family DNA-binding transcription regulator [Weizmannia acidilactici]GER65786.1 putative HTH-type transcriptional regulator YdjF [Weizmannia acidilactici]GER71152.1 putative HTH-type transcriptional regulator YdjF [Weizmannia acidilactici]GER74865.1 putative HTH-type transcriptional regulator YdjF [Weizmannia acidilactici]
MLAFERRDKILNTLYREKKVYVANLAKEFQVTEETIRRDLEKLEKEGIVSRTYGGAVLNLHTNEDLPYQTRFTANIEAKQNIAGKLHPLISDGNTVVADASSTVLEGLKELNHSKEGLVVLTNSAIALSELSQSNINLISTGGTLRKRSNSLVGSLAENAVRHYNVDVALFSCKGISMTHGITDSNEAESNVKKQMLQQASKVILLADHTKFDKIAFVNFVDVSAVDFVVTDEKPSNEWLRYFKEQQVDIIF